jgi:hypothetical protein
MRRPGAAADDRSAITSGRELPADEETWARWVRVYEHFTGGMRR